MTIATDTAVGDGRALFRITGEVLAQFLHLPEGVVIEAIEADMERSGDFRVRVAGPGVPRVAPGAAIKYVDPTYRRVSSENAETIEFVSWGKRQ